ncbi:hypothetical protein ASPU41_09895 [Arthrobacter sp. U41]|nr:hypothetical protein ASPU41_09895 [Arthrobacter sp. U41]
MIHKEQWTIQLQNGVPWFIPPPHLDPRQKPRRNYYFHPTDLSTAAWPPDYAKRKQRVAAESVRSMGISAFQEDSEGNAMALNEFVGRDHEGPADPGDEGPAPPSDTACRLEGREELRAGAG